MTIAILRAMEKLLKKKHLYTTAAAGFILVMLVLLFSVLTKKAPDHVTTTAEQGSVRQLVSVSGVTKAKEKAALGFEENGVVENVLVEVGDQVEAGETLAILRSSKAENDRLAAMAALKNAIAIRSELIAGPTASAREVIDETVTLAEASLETTIKTETEKVAAAKQTLLSDGLFAYTETADEEASAPQVSGTYRCETEGSYRLEFFSSSAPSGYSVRLSGIESGTFTTSTDQPLPLGNCGLRLKLVAGARYTGSVWIIDIPNTKSASYTLNKNAYDVAVIQASSAIDLARQEVQLAKAEATDSLATPRSEALEQANAAVLEAQAQLAGFESELADRVLRAPFAGTITALFTKTGEVTTSDPVMNIVANGAFDIIARVPEIDIGKLSTGQKVELLFDAKRDEPLTGEVSFVSLEATEIDGVAYFDTYITLSDTPAWMRSGLNADIDIIVAESSQGVRIPKRFLIETDGQTSVLTLEDSSLLATTSVEVLLKGNDGFVSVLGLSTGEVIVAP